MILLNIELSRISAYMLRVLAWVLNYLVIWPIAGTVLITVLLFWQDNTTPGTEIVHAVNVAKMETTTGNFLITRCKATSNDKLKKEPPIPNIHCDNQTFTVDAHQYASHLDKELWNIVKVLWTTMAVVLGLIACCLGTFPVYRAVTQTACVCGINPKEPSETKGID